MSVDGTINGQPAREALKDLRCMLCRAPISLNEIKKLYFKNLFRSPGEKVHGFDIEVSVIRIPEEEQKQYLDRKIVNEAEERMGMLLKAKRI